MSDKKKKIVLIILGIGMFLFLAVSMALYLTYLQAVRNEADIKLQPFAIIPSENIKLGDVLTVSLDLSSPWGHYPEKAEISSEKGVQVVSEPVITKLKNKWGTSVWNIKAQIQPYRTGKIKSELCNVTFLSGKKGEKSRNITTTIPEFTVLAVDTGKKRSLDLASEVLTPPMSSSKTWIMIILAILAFAGIVVFSLIWFLKRKKYLESIVVPPWVLAISKLNDLRMELNNKLINRQLCITRLTDIVRNYLEKRFSLPATAQTTHEFLHDLDKSDSPLIVEHRNFLRDFLSSSDLVKFANLPADSSLVDNAMEKAEELINSTVPSENDDSIQNNKEDNY